VTDSSPLGEQPDAASSGSAGSAPIRLTDRDRMPGWVRRALIWFFMGVIGLFVLRFLVESLSGLLIITFASLFISFAIEPAVNYLEDRGVRRGVGTAAVFLVLIFAISLFVIAIGSVLATQLTDFVNDAPARINSLQAWLQDNVSEEIDLTDLRDQFVEAGGLGERITSLAGDVFGFGSSAIGLLFDLFTLGLFTFYMAADGPKFRRTVCSIFPPDRQKTINQVWDLAVEKTGGYILSRSILALISAAVHWLAFVLLDVPFPVPLALWMGVVSQFIPVVGSYLAGALPVVISLLDRPITGVWVLIAVIVYQQIENYLFAPRITAQTMAIHPAVAFGSVIAGTALLGPVGALLALPASATIQGFLSTYLNYYDVAATGEVPVIDADTEPPPGPSAMRSWAARFFPS